MVLDEEQRHPVRQRDLAERRELHRAQPFGRGRTGGEGLLSGKLDCWNDGKCDESHHSNLPTFHRSHIPAIHRPPPDAGAAPGLTISSVRLPGARYVFATRFTSSLVTASRGPRSVLISSMDAWKVR